MELTQLLGIFLTGLLAGGISCMAVQGGLLAASIANRSRSAQEQLNQKEASLTVSATEGNAQPIFIFLLAKLVAYTILGFLLGWLGSAFQFSTTVQVILQVVIGLFMLATALHLLKIHRIFRYVVLQPPHFLTKLIRRETKSKSIFAPAVLGALTVFIPCGATQAVMALSIAAGNPIAGALILFAFILGTSPIFFLLGYFTSRLTNSTQSVFTRFAAVILFSFAVLNLNNAVALTGSNYTLETLSRNTWCFISYCSEDTIYAAPATDTSLTINTAGYTPNQISVKAGEEVTLHLTNKDSNNCAQSFTIPSLGLKQVVPLGTSQTIHFKAPQEPGQLSFMCSMGMYRGTIHVI